MTERYPGYKFITNIKKEQELHALVCLELAGVKNYKLFNDAYSMLGEPLPNHLGIATKEYEEQEYKINLFFEYSSQFAIRMCEILQRNGIIPKDAPVWMEEYDTFLGCDISRNYGMELVYYPRE